MNTSAYHVLLRISALTVAIILVFDSGLLSPVTKQLSHNTQDYVASAIGVKASVRATDINTLTAQISERDRELDQREAAIEEREITVGLNTAGSQSSDQTSTYILSVILFIILVLIVINFALDFARSRRFVPLNNNEQSV